MSRAEGTGAVHVLRALSYDNVGPAVEALLARLPAMERLGPESRVLIKPNLLSEHPPADAATTHPAILRAVIEALARRGVAHITVADSPGGPWTPARMERVYRVCGIEPVCRETGALAYTECGAGQGPHRAENRYVRSFRLMQPALACDCIINLPKLKTHVLMGMSGAVKNLFGLVPGLEKAESHMRFPQREAFGHMLVDLCESVQAQIHLIDGVTGMEGDGPAGGNPRDYGLLLAGEDPYALDLAVCRLMGLAPMNVPFLRAAHERGLCPAALPQGLARGEALQVPQGFRPPRSYDGPLDFSRNLPRPLRPVGRVFAHWAAPKPKVRRGRCIGCGKCAQICPKQVIDMAGGKASIRAGECIRCFCCHEMCPAKAIDVHRLAIFTHHPAR